MLTRLISVESIGNGVEAYNNVCGGGVEVI